MSFGSAALDGLFRGMRKGGTFALTYDEMVPFSAIRLVTIPAVINALNTGKAAFGVPLPGASNKEVADMIKPFVSPEAYRNCLAIGSLGTETDLEPPLYAITDSDPKEASARISELVARVIGKSETRSVLLMESLGTFEAPFATKIDSVVEEIGARSGAIRGSGTDALMLLIQHDSPIFSRMLAISGRYARLFTRDRSVVLIGEKPSTPAYALDHSPGNPLQAQLTLIV
ncbi:MAG: hypothetical protein KGI38_10920 [Thaumarchaeota archaeon]|nr:hypothetical protein [Nitrososphaerota archaeon]